MGEQQHSAQTQDGGPFRDAAFWDAVDQLPVAVWEEDWSEVFCSLSREFPPDQADLEALLATAPAILRGLLDKARVTGANASARRIIGSPEAITPATFLRRAASIENSARILARALARTQTGGTCAGELVTASATGQEIRGALTLDFTGTATTGRVLVVFSPFGDLEQCEPTGAGRGELPGTNSGEPTRAEEREEALRAEQNFSGSLLDALPGVFYLYDEEGHFLRWNSEFLRITGYDEQELSQLHPLHFFTPEEQPLVQERIREVFASGYSAVEADFVTKDGRRLPYFFTGRRIRYQGRDCLLGVGIDLSRARRAEEADRLKSAFLATMSHELRTPLNSIIGFTGVLLQGLAGPLNPEQTKQLTMVQSSARHLLALINDVLDLSKIEAGQLVVEQTPFPVRRAVDTVVASLAPAAEKKGLSLRVDVPEDLGEVVSDERRVSQILLNLLANAIKFTEQGGVELHVENVEEPVPAVRFAVRDTGPGIRVADLAKIFLPFRQAESGLARKHEGSGLGLAICQRLAELLGAQLGVNSEVSVGSTFTFILPRHKENAS